MEELTFEIESNEEIWELIDKEVNYILVHQFNPNEALEWWRTSMKIKEGVELGGIAVRNMSFDLLTDLSSLKQIIDLNTRQLRVYQFDKPVPDTSCLKTFLKNQEVKF